jgi:hypothetical protein
VCPVADAAGSYTITVQLVFDVPPTSDLTRWGGIYFGATTDACPDDADTSTGYLVALRWNGTLEVFRQPPDGSGMVSMGATRTSPIATPVLSEELSDGVGVTSIPVTALPDAVLNGHRFALPTGQLATVSTPAVRGATSLSIGRLTPSDRIPAGTALVQEVAITIAKTPVGFTVGRTDDGPDMASHADATWSGGYIFLRNSGDAVAAVSCSSLTISEPEATMGRNVVVHERMGDPAGYSITYADGRQFLVTRLTDCVDIGRYDTRVAAIAAAEADRAEHDA